MLYCGNILQELRIEDYAANRGLSLLHQGKLDNKAGVVFSQVPASSGTVLVISGNKPITYFAQDPLGLNEKHW